VFNVGNRRRTASRGDNNNGASHSHAFFDPKNNTAKALRDSLALESLEELIAWLKLGGRVGIHGKVDMDVCLVFAVAGNDGQVDNVFLYLYTYVGCVDATNSSRERRYDKDLREKYALCA